jgi:hypothetical protein
MNPGPLRLRALLLVVPLCSALLLSSSARSSVPQEPKPTPEGRGSRGEAPQGGPERPRGPRGERGPANLHNSMEQMGRAMDQVNATIGDPTKSEETLVGLGRMIQFAGASVTGEPKNLAEQPEDKRVAHKNAFRREILTLDRQLIDIELMVLDGKHTEAQASFKKLPAIADAAHGKFAHGDDESEKDGPPVAPPKK